MASPAYTTVPQTPTTPVSMEYSYSSSLQAGHPLKVQVGSPSYVLEDASQEYPSPVSPMLTEQDRKLKNRIRYLRLLARLAGTAIALTTVSQEGRTIYTFSQTQNTIRGGRGPWAKETQIWSSILMFATSLITALLGISIVIAYFFSVKVANTISGVSGIISIVVEVVHLSIWFGVAVAYRVAKNGKDLWGWACSPVAEKIQPNFEGIVNFKNVCARGKTTWQLSVANVIVNVLALGILALVYRRTRTKKEIKRLTMTHA